MKKRPAIMRAHCRNRKHFRRRSITRGLGPRDVKRPSLKTEIEKTQIMAGTCRFKKMIDYLAPQAVRKPK